ncbi:Bacteriohemerythrin [Fundidesulfovibrio magnetotacticus]|uniref:Bacteriohemerythrin n=1 Tax=Fundidesulfovibrio magnetotacticus TaxID=2730080 RepID=A0A6V8LS12_9BACT|nr:hemerythrin family protein [Fundidesulfovibrio magnetotacticus]GFK94524.1 Bacteriohemerythrin [Fundidesulfovibrio magnetotacticus]
MIEWNDSLCTGVEEIDAQHRELVRRYNVFSQAAADGAGAAELAEMLRFMHAYAEEHFRTEERFMERTGYPGLPSHILQHREFTGRQFWLLEGADSPETVQETVDFLREWIARHVGEVDAKIGLHVRELARKS